MVAKVNVDAGVSLRSDAWQKAEAKMEDLLHHLNVRHRVVEAIKAKRVVKIMKMSTRKSEGGY